MVSISLFWNTNMVTVTSCENALYVLNLISFRGQKSLGQAQIGLF